MVRTRTISTQPQLALDASHVKAFWKVVVMCERLRGDSDRAAWRLVLANGLAPVAFGLIQILQSEMRAEFKRTETKAERCSACIDIDGGSALREAQIADGEFDS